MADVEQIHVGDLGTAFEAELVDEGEVLDLSSASVKQLIFLPPGQAAVTKVAELTTDGTDGKMQYVTEADFLDTAGLWQWQPYVELPGGAWHGDIAEFRVYANLA